jgi:hypothetical protein
MGLLENPIAIPLVGTIFGTVMVVAIVAIVFSFKSRERELQVRQEMQVRQFDHERRMKELDLEIAKTRAQSAATQRT